MKHQAMQNRIENAVYSAIEDIADEFDIEVSEYPEVNWLSGRRGELNDLGISEHDQKFLKFLKKMKSSCTFGRKPRIFIVCDNYLDVAEEAAHYVHFTASKVSSTGLNSNQEYSLRIISEALAFLGTKTIVPERKNKFSKYPDMFYMNVEEKKKTLKEIKENEKPERAAEYFVYQQGYGLGERMFYDSLSGKTKKEELRMLLTAKLGRELDPNIVMAHLKFRYWPPVNQTSEERIISLAEAGN